MPLTGRIARMAETSLKSLRLRDLLTFAYLSLPILAFPNLSRQNFYRQTTVEFIRYDVCWFKTWCTGIFLWWQNFYIGIIVWDVKCGTVWENMVSVDFKHGVCGYFYGENLARQYICGDIILRYRVSSKTCSLFYDLSAKTHLNAKFGGTSKK